VKRYSSIMVPVLFLLLSLACVETSSPPASNPKPITEQDLAITFGGFIQNGPQDQLLDGRCSPHLTRDVFNATFTTD
jgi:hypothetical protein